MKTNKGYFKPRNPAKYRGNPSNIIYRSGWELKLMLWLDGRSDVINWGSEEVVIPYRSPIDGRLHRYFVDFIVTTINKEGIKETTNPRNRKYISEVMTWGVNEAKWKAATEYCKDRGWKFQIFTEKELGITF